MCTRCGWEIVGRVNQARFNDLRRKNQGANGKQHPQTPDAVFRVGVCDSRTRFCEGKDHAGTLPLRRLRSKAEASPVRMVRNDTDESGRATGG